MGFAEIVLVTAAAVVVAVAAAVVAVVFSKNRDRSAVVDDALRRALEQISARASTERDDVLRHALDHASALQREQAEALAARLHDRSLDELSAKKDTIDTRLDEVRSEMRRELHRLATSVTALSEASAQRFGQVDAAVRAHAEITRSLSQSTQALSEAIANPTARGQWGERMAEDILRSAGFIENVNYHKQTQLDGATGRPDFTFPLPRGHELYMDVKFPMSAYLRYTATDDDAERRRHRAAFVRDVRDRIRELARREYAALSARQSVDYVLLFLPSEQLTGFIHESDPALIDDALADRVVLCSPLTLFAFLGVVRQAYDNFVVEQTSDQILGLIGEFGHQWQKYCDHVETVKKTLDRLDRQFDDLTGVRRRQLDKPLARLDEIRRERDVPIDTGNFGPASALDRTAPDDEALLTAPDGENR